MQVFRRKGCRQAQPRAGAPLRKLSLHHREVSLRRQTRPTLAGLVIHLVTDPAAKHQLGIGALALDMVMLEGVPTEDRLLLTEAATPAPILAVMLVAENRILDLGKRRLAAETVIEVVPAMTAGLLTRGRVQLPHSLHRLRLTKEGLAKEFPLLPCQWHPAVVPQGSM